MTAILYPKISQSLVLFFSSFLACHATSHSLDQMIVHISLRLSYQGLVPVAVGAGIRQTGGTLVNDRDDDWQMPGLYIPNCALGARSL